MKWPYKREKRCSAQNTTTIHPVNAKPFAGKSRRTNSLLSNEWINQINKQIAQQIGETYNTFYKKWQDDIHHCECRLFRLFENEVNRMNPSTDLPCNVDMEKQLLTAMLIRHGEIIPKVNTILSYDDFYRSEHRIIFQIILWLYEQGNSVQQLVHF